VNVIERGAALAVEAQTPSAKSETSTIVPVARLVLRPTAASSPDPVSLETIDVLSLFLRPGASRIGQRWL
jgi:hypothetical protein